LDLIQTETSLRKEHLLQFSSFRLHDVYVRSWIQAPGPVSSPTSDLDFLRVNTTDYRNNKFRLTNTTVSQKHNYVVSE